MRIPFGHAVVVCILSVVSLSQQLPAPGAGPGNTTAPSAGGPGTGQAPAPPDYSQQPFVVEHYRQSARFENDGTGREEQEAAIRVISESGVQALGQLKVGYSALSDKLTIAYVRVRKPDGSVVTAQESAVQDLTLPDAPVYTDYHQKHISVPSLRPGDTLEYHYIRDIVNPLIPGQFWTSYNFNDTGIVLDEQVEINIPKSREVKLKTRPGYEPKTGDEGDRRIYRWSHSQTKEESSKKRLDPDEPPAIQLTTFQSWEQLGDWYRSLETDRRRPNDAVKAKADALVADKSDDMAKVKALYDYVSRDYRYVSLSFGLGRYQPHAASEVLSVGYGDCKDKNTLLASLLQAEGFASTSVLINARRDLDPEVPSPSQFDHVITRVPVAGQEIWLDSTSGIVPFRMLAFSLRDKEALAVPPAGKPGLVRTPAEIPFAAFDQSRIDGSVNDTGKLTAHFWTRVRGDQELPMRALMRQIPSTKWKDVLQSALRASPLRSGEITNFHISDPSDTDIPFQIDYDIAVSNYFDWSTAEPKFPLPLAALRLPAPDSEQKKPIKIGQPAEMASAAAISLPAKYTVQLPLGVDIRRDYVEYHSSYKLNGNQLEAMRVFRIVEREIPVDRREDWAAFRRVVESDQSQIIHLDNKSPGASGLTGGSSAKELFESGTQALASRNYELAIQMFEKAAAIDPTYKGLWSALGRAYLANQQTPKAVEAFQQQIAGNPYDETAYSDLGLAYEEQQKYEEAIAQFKKQIEINPLDPNPHAYLGMLYVHLQRFPEAVPELEKALSIQPRSPLLLINLGQAYLATQQTERGMAAMDKAISIAPSPLVWNNVAYSLAEQNVQLPRADAYADAAITAGETQLRDVSLAGLKYQDLGTTQMLFNLWDTKGWVEFKQGNTDKAEAYILPAWQATGGGAIAEHLGDIADKRGAKQQAARYYAMSLATDSPGVTSRAKLAALGMSSDAMNPAIAQARKAMVSERTVNLSAVQAGVADFFLLVSPGKIEDVKFVKGEESLRSLADLLKGSSIPMQFPPGAQAHVLRRVRVACGTTPPSKNKAKGKDKAAASAAQSSTAAPLPGPCTAEWLPTSEVRGID
jgi:tetratricopeptide (TPR) repeat protein